MVENQNRHFVSEKHTETRYQHSNDTNKGVKNGEAISIRNDKPNNNGTIITLFPNQSYY